MTAAAPPPEAVAWGTAKGVGGEVWTCGLGVLLVGGLAAGREPTQKRGGCRVSAALLRPQSPKAPLLVELNPESH